MSEFFTVATQTSKKNDIYKNCGKYAKALVSGTWGFRNIIASTVLFIFFPLAFFFFFLPNIWGVGSFWCQKWTFCFQAETLIYICISVLSRHIKPPYFCFTSTLNNMGHLVLVALCHVSSRVQKQHNQTKAGWYGPSLDIQQENFFFFFLFNWKESSL